MKYDLVEMLSYMRPEGSKVQKKFCKKYLEPVMGKPDEAGNYTLILGDKPNIAFMSHHDTVHVKDGRQQVYVNNTGEAFSLSDCLGADCTTGVWLTLNMIEAKIPGVYVVHAGEEVGCIGSRFIAESRPHWINHVDAAISFDRRGNDSIVTHQLGFRTASEPFAQSLSDALKLEMYPDDGGAYTDSNEYADIIPECTNISVGYYNQHTESEYQDLGFAEKLLRSLLNADWSTLQFERTPMEPLNYLQDDLYKLVFDYPDCVSEMLVAFGFSSEDLKEFIYQEKGYVA